MDPAGRVEQSASLKSRRGPIALRPFRSVDALIERKRVCRDRPRHVPDHQAHSALGAPAATRARRGKPNSRPRSPNQGSTIRSAATEAASARFRFSTKWLCLVARLRGGTRSVPEPLLCDPPGEIPPSLAARSAGRPRRMAVAMAAAPCNWPCTSVNLCGSRPSARRSVASGSLDFDHGSRTRETAQMPGDQFGEQIEPAAGEFSLLASEHRFLARGPAFHRPKPGQRPRSLGIEPASIPGRASRWAAES